MIRIQPCFHRDHRAFSFGQSPTTHVAKASCSTVFVVDEVYGENAVNVMEVTKPVFPVSLVPDPKRSVIGLITPPIIITLSHPIEITIQKTKYKQITK